ncbi:MAG TPA: hypothetical protein VHV51_13620 [Polyangiaceae bacterium]|nr:hypothetical protein [Polyangiaceae bacterium]
MSKFFYLGLLCAAFVVAAFGCTSTREVDVASLPPDVRADYAVFAQRCSKCHSLARPLNSGIDNDDYWKLYVERMRRQPGSGISIPDTVPILRFLHFYSLEERRKKGELADEPAPAALPATDGGASEPAPAAASPVSSAEPAPVSATTPGAR